MEPAVLTVPERKTLAFSLLFCDTLKLQGKSGQQTRIYQNRLYLLFFFLSSTAIYFLLFLLCDFKLSVSLFYDYSLCSQFPNCWMIFSLLLCQLICGTGPEQSLIDGKEIKLGAVNLDNSEWLVKRGILE